MIKQYQLLVTSLCLLAITFTPAYSASTLPNEALFDWVEYKFSSLFPQNRTVKTDLTYEGVHYDLRYWSGDWGTRYLGITDDGEIFGLGDFTDGSLKSFGFLEDWENAIIADEDKVYNLSDKAYFNEPRFLFAEEDDGRSVSGHYTIGDDRILGSAVGDFDGNGFDDILMTFPGYDDSSGNKVGSSIRIYLSNANGTLTEATNTIIEGSIPATQFTRRTFVADFNGDGIDDVFLANHGLELPSPDPGIDWHEPDTLLLSSPGGKLIDASSNLPANDFYSHGGAIGDIDGDGDIDILTNTNNWPPSGIQVYLNNGNGTFTVDNSGIPQVEYMPGHFTGVSGALWIELLDVDNDGDLDLFKAGNAPDDHYIALNNGNGDFSIEPPIILPPLKWSNFGIEGASVADFNLDGLSDLLLVETDSSSNPWNHELQLLISNGDGTFSDQTAARLPAPADVTTNTFTHIADLNQDGSPEILFMLRQANNPLPFFYLNDGTGNFSRIGDGYLPDDFPASYHPIDLSNDGDIDFIISGLWSEELRISGTFILEATRVPRF